MELFRSENRYRDIDFEPDGRTIYVITDMMGPVQAMKEGPITPSTTLWDPGSLPLCLHMSDSFAGTLAIFAGHFCK